MQSRMAQLRQWVEHVLPERQLYLRSNHETKAYVITTGHQIVLAAGAAGLAIWTLGATASILVAATAEHRNNEKIALMRAQSERWIADRQARLDTLAARYSESSDAFNDLAKSIEHRHAALTLVMDQFKDTPGAKAVLRPTVPDANKPAIDRVLSIRADQERLVNKAETFAQSRAERLRMAFRLAGLNPASYSGSSGGVGGPLIDAKDPRALAAMLDVDEPFAARISHAVDDLNAMKNLQSAAIKLPLRRPTNTEIKTTSGYGVRFDPFTGRPTFHAGMDFAGSIFTPIASTAPGIVSFTGVRTGYGNVVEIDHGGGFLTRYAHLQSYAVSPGQRVAVGQRIGAMGSTGRSTGPHLHYEIWVNGRQQNPARFVKAGDYVQQN